MLRLRDAYTNLLACGDDCFATTLFAYILASIRDTAPLVERNGDESVAAHSREDSCCCDAHDRLCNSRDNRIADTRSNRVDDRPFKHYYPVLSAFRSVPRRDKGGRAL